MKNRASRKMKNLSRKRDCATILYSSFFIKARLRTLKFPFISASSRTHV